MSWNITVTGVRRQDAEEKLEEAAEAYWPNLNPNAMDEAKEQYEGCKAAVLALLDVVQTGAPDDALNISVAGHANPDHGLAKGYAREAVNISVSGQV